VQFLCQFKWEAEAEYLSFLITRVSAELFVVDDIEAAIA